MKSKKLRDFTLKTYRDFCIMLKSHGYVIQNVTECIHNPKPKAAIIRHDVDSWPINSYQMASIENELGLSATYYFRRSPISFNGKIVKNIIDLGHEIGYHYEDLASEGGNYKSALDSFINNLDFFRTYYPVKTVAMHGRPLSKWNSMDLWDRYNYKDLGIECEPYLDLDYSRMAYLTDTGNCWDGERYSVRDHVRSAYNIQAHSTFDLIGLINSGNLPDRVLFNIHPARWNDNLAKWLIRYYILTLPKYQAKKWLKQKRSRGVS